MLLALCVLVLGRYALGGKGQGPGTPGPGVAAAETLAPETGATAGRPAVPGFELVNLASPVSDGIQIVVPSRSDSDEHELAPGSPVAPDTTVPARIRLSTATLEELDTLPGVGPVTTDPR